MTNPFLQFWQILCSEFMDDLSDFVLVATFAIDDFRPVGRIAGFEFIRTMLRGMTVPGQVFIDAVFGFRSRALALPLPKFDGVALTEPPVMPAIRAQPRNRHS